MASIPTIAYLSMEVGLEPDIPTYAGGLGMLAGDTLRAAADLGLPLVAISLVHRQGYLRQVLDDDGVQTEEPHPWSPEERLEEAPGRVELNLRGHRVAVRAWRYTVSGATGGEVPVLLLDTDLPENREPDRRLTDRLYAGDQHHRLAQEAVLGLGGLYVLRALGYEPRCFHLNEGHAALLALGLLAEQDGGAPNERLEAVRQHCVFTTHTPVPAGHDKFDSGLVREVLGVEMDGLISSTECCLEGALNMTWLALKLSRYVNGVAMRHRKVSRGMFPDYPIDSITNGVHGTTWADPAFCALYDRHIPEWRYDNLNLRYAFDIPTGQIQEAHDQARRRLFEEVARRTGVALRPDLPTLGFARRATEYKRADLLLADVERLRGIARRAGGFQVLYAGKAHPRDEGGKAMIRRVVAAARELAGDVTVLYLAGHDMRLGRLLCAGVDVWLNTPQRPLEASGTSGMKAAVNGVPSLSVLDGWWCEGHVEGVTGWVVGGDGPDATRSREVDDLYDKLEHVVLPACRDRAGWARLMRSTIALNASFFNAQRMVLQYAENAYGRWGLPDRS